MAKVKDLIKKLQEFDPNSPVCAVTYGRASYARPIIVHLTQVVREKRRVAVAILVDVEESFFSSGEEVDIMAKVKTHTEYWICYCYYGFFENIHHITTKECPSCNVKEADAKRASVKDVNKMLYQNKFMYSPDDMIDDCWI